MDSYHEIFQKHVTNLEAKLEEAHDTIGELELDIQEKDELIASMVCELRRLRADREFSVVDIDSPEAA